MMTEVYRLKNELGLVKCNAIKYDIFVYILDSYYKINHPVFTQHIKCKYFKEIWALNSDSNDDNYSISCFILKCDLKYHK